MYVGILVMSVEEQVKTAQLVHLEWQYQGVLYFFPDICQLRLDFDNFDIVETTTGVCTDSLTIAGPTGRNPMDLCGTLTGLHGK